MLNQTTTTDFDWDLLDNETARRKKIPNESILNKHKDAVYNHHGYALEYYEEVMKRGLTSKEPEVGAAFPIVDIVSIVGTEVSVTIEGGIECLLDFNNERTFVSNMNFNSVPDFIDFLSTEAGAAEFIDQKYYVVIEQSKPHNRGSITKGQSLRMKDEFYTQIDNPTTAYYGTIIEKNRGGFLINVQGVHGFLPGSLAATNIVRNFDAMIGKVIPVMVEDYLKDSDTFVFSYKKYVKNVLPQKIDDLTTKEHYVGNITGVMKFGLFIEFNEFFTGLLHTSKMSEAGKERFRLNVFKEGDSIDIWIQEIAADKKIILTDIDPAIQRKELEEYRKNNMGVSKMAEVLYVKPFATLVKLEKDIVGLISQKELKSKRMTLHVGDTVSVSMGHINENNKLYLLIAD